MTRYRLSQLRRTLLCLALAGGIGAGALALAPHRGPVAMPPLDGAVTWFNSAALGPEQLRGKVVLVDFWTYSCINCIRTMPYLRAWSAKYRSHGLTVIGVHTPEFKFEHDLVEVSAAIARFQIDFPVAVDSGQRIWNAWGNVAWPAFYLVDARGKVRYKQLGEGDYDKLERTIQSLLTEARGAPLAPELTGLVAPPAGAEQAAPDLAHLGSRESYIGQRHASNFASPERMRADRAQAYSVGSLGRNQWGLFGTWTVGAESATALQPGSGIAYRFHARDLHLVMKAAEPGRPLRFRVTLDGRAPGADHGADIDADGNGVIKDARLYQLIRQSGLVQPRRFEIRFLDQGTQAYAFTFG